MLLPRAMLAITTWMGMATATFSAEILYVAPPSWVAAAPAGSPAAPVPGAAVQARYLDQQIKVVDGGSERYVAYREKILTPAGLSVGNITIRWNPSNEDVRIHKVSIIRGTETIDVLKTDKFRVVESDDQSAVEILKGDLVARMQVRGLQVGDEIEVVQSRLQRHAGFKDSAFDVVQWPMVETRGEFRFKLDWPKDVALRWKTSKGLPEPTEIELNGRRQLTVQAANLSAVELVDGAPNRFNIRRRIDFSSYTTWSQVSNAYWAIVNPTTKLAADSAVLSEAKSITEGAKDPKERMLAALKLVQDRIRYVYIGLDGGNYRPTRPDETWQLKFGDCKAKSVLLQALLRELGIESELVLVNSNGPDGLDQLLPTPLAFDHVVVRAEISGEQFWLDGTRSSGQPLSPHAVYAFRYALPVRSGYAQFEALPYQPTTRPILSAVTNIDARLGFKDPVPVEVNSSLRGDQVEGLRQTLSALGPVDAERAVKQYYQSERPWLTLDKASWHYDEIAEAIILTGQGKGQLTLNRDLLKNGSVDVISAGFRPPGKLRRPPDQDASVPWQNSFPHYNHYTTIIHLPPPPRGRAWTYSADPVHQVLGADYYWRHAGINGGMFWSSMSVRSLAPELTSDQAEQLNNDVDDFDNSISTISLDDSDIRSNRPNPEIVGMVYNPENQRILKQALEKITAGKLDGVDKLLDRAYLDEPESAVILQLRGGYFTMVGQPKEALRDFNDSLRFAPLNPSVLEAAASAAKEIGAPPPPDYARRLLKPDEIRPPKW